MRIVVHPVRELEVLAVEGGRALAVTHRQRNVVERHERSIAAGFRPSAWKTECWVSGCCHLSPITSGFLPNRRGLRPSLGTASVLAARGSLNGSEPDWETAGVVGVAPKAQVVPFRVMRGLAGARNLIVVAKI